MTIDVAFESASSWPAELDAGLWVLSCSVAAPDDRSRRAAVAGLSEKLTSTLGGGPGVPELWVLVTDYQVISRRASSASIRASRQSLATALSLRGADLAGREVIELEVDLDGGMSFMRAGLVRVDSGGWGWAVATLYAVGVVGIASWSRSSRPVVEDAARRILSEKLPSGPALRFAALNRLDPRSHELAMLATFGWFDDREFGVELFVPESPEARALGAK